MSETNAVRLFDISGDDWESDPGSHVASKSELDAILQELSRGEPRIFKIVWTGGTSLEVGLGGSYACAQFTAPIPELSEAYSSWSARTRHIKAVENVEFLLGKTPTPISPEYCLSFDEVLLVAEFFFETGSRHPEFKWVQFC